MFDFLCKSVLHGRNTIKVLFICQNDLSSLISVSRTLRFISSSSKRQSFTVSYLKNSCGLSSESALKASEHVHFKTPEKPDSVIALFKNYGFSESQITRLVKKRPVVLISDAEKTLLPKLEFFRSRGVSSPDLAKIVCNTPTTMALSLENQIIPSFNFLGNVLKSDEKIIHAVRCYPRILGYSPNAVLLPNINMLLDNGVPECNIATTLYSMPSTLIKNPIEFKDRVDEAKEMGFNPSRSMFMVALFVMSTISKPTLKRRFEVFKKFGWSEEEVLEAFRRYPTCIKVSEDKLMAIMDFLVNKMGFQPSLFAKQPRILLMSLEKKIVPRCLFVLDMLSKGVIKRINMRTLFNISDSEFIEKFVNCYKAALLKLYKEKLDLSKKLENGQVQAATLVDKKFGWFEEEVFEAFRRYPTFVKVSEDKFMAIMDFLVNKMGFQPSHIAKHPRIVMMSLAKKIVPRCLFVLDMLSKGVIKRLNMRTLFETSDSLFIEKFLNCYKAELLKLYKEKLDLSKKLENGQVQTAKLIDC